MKNENEELKCPHTCCPPKKACDNKKCFYLQNSVIHFEQKIAAV